ncbi:hypothetical protein P378_11575 [Desulforamulus profundi]|uniref:Uncharacterized protein n=1 Tax=Desulforamulus profundi TaxID=1383067 RepID=A0A2C6MDK1_9FIRM|nr:hypothetical protein [Desulforamulus profundi]PHJ38178.1 hypothetical protein P378_11575 [Desulforamulus profundi]
MLFSVAGIMAIFFSTLVLGTINTLYFNGQMTQQMGVAATVGLQLGLTAGLFFFFLPVLKKQVQERNNLYQHVLDQLKQQVNSTQNSGLLLEKSQKQHSLTFEVLDRVNKELEQGNARVATKIDGLTELFTQSLANQESLKICLKEMCNVVQTFQDSLYTKIGSLMDEEQKSLTVFEQQVQGLLQNIDLLQRDNRALLNQLVQLEKGQAATYQELKELFTTTGSLLQEMSQASQQDLEVLMKIEKMAHNERKIFGSL